MPVDTLTYLELWKTTNYPYQYSYAVKKRIASNCVNLICLLMDTHYVNETVKTMAAGPWDCLLYTSRCV